MSDRRPAPSRPDSRSAPILYVTLAIVGAVISAAMSWAHHDLLRNSASAILPFCGDPASSCATALLSESSTLFGVPVSSFAFLYCAILIGTGLWMLRPSGTSTPDAARGIAVALAVITTGAFLFSLRMAWIGIMSLDVVCVWCLTLLAINGMVSATACLGLSRYRSMRSDRGATRFLSSYRHELLCVGAILVAVVLGLILGDETDHAKYLRRSGLDHILTSTAPRVEILDDGPLLGPPIAPVLIAAFLDYDCSLCRQMNRQLSLLAEEPGGCVRVVVRQFPLDPACNPAAGRTGHPGACRAAMLAESLLIKEGQDSFYRYHHAVMNGNGTLAENVDAALEELRVTETALGDVGPQATERVAADIQLGRDLGVVGTPYLFVNGYAVRGSVKPWALRLIVDELAKRVPNDHG